MSFERSYSIGSHERIKQILIWQSKPTFAVVGHIYKMSQFSSCGKCIVFKASRIL